MFDAPVDECPLGVHQVELVIQAGPGLSDGSSVAEHADSTLNLGKVSSRNNSGRLVVDADLEASRTPVHKLDGALGLDGGNSSVHILGDDITSVEEAAGHVLAMAGVALDHLVGRLKAGIGDLSHGELLMVGLLRGDDRSIGDQRKVDPWVGHQVGLELSEVHIESSIKAERGSNG